LKLIEKEHEEKEYFIQKITELTPSIISVYEIKTGRFQFINRAVQTIMGYRPEDLLERGAVFFMQNVHPEDLPRVLAEYQAAVEEANQNHPANAQRIREFTYRMRHADGQWRWFHSFASVFERDVNGEVETVINVSLDVTTQQASDLTIRQNTEEIRKQEDRYYKMIDEVQDYAILLLSTEGIIENWNSGAEKIKGYKSQEIVGKNFRIFYPPEDRQTNLPEKLILEASQKGRASHEGWRVRKDQTRFWGSIVITALHNKQGDVIGFSKVTRDLTKVKLAEDERRKYNRNLSIKMKSSNKKIRNLNRSPILPVTIYRNPSGKYEFGQTVWKKKKTFQMI
jgi:PAS domain S-box-containing protein